MGAVVGGDVGVSLEGYWGGSFWGIFGRQFYEDIWEAVLGGYLVGSFRGIFGGQF